MAQLEHERNIDAVLMATSAGEASRTSKQILPDAMGGRWRAHALKDQQPRSIYATKPHP
jgi:hypothetical protein